ncbi:universal stress protein [Streptomyces sp. C1-2]|uniref:universal stress protein n=1 Tax=Streptomyces sp. C1-2 TaxID=2720022 RepID=UPI001432455A|nr:universal stress protein [Streptomyces sp. C1-2]NJP73710.1 universal stress protein [Streptomyces sp. C1-2]
MAEQPPKSGRIVVGVDGSDASKRALRWGVRYARLTGDAVTAVTAWDFPSMHGARWLPPSSTDAAALEDRSRKSLTDAVAEVAGAPGPAEVEADVRYGSPAGVLLDAAKGASLLVVGSRGLGGVSGLLLGSVAQLCVQRADCPVLVIRGDG